MDGRIKLANVRATRLAMACGLLSLRFFGNVLLVRGFGFRWEDLSLNDIRGATCISPDLRNCIQQEVSNNGNNKSVKPIPRWLADAAQNNYHDKAALAEVARAMDGGMTKAMTKAMTKVTMKKSATTKRRNLWRINRRYYMAKLESLLNLLPRVLCVCTVDHLHR